MDEPRAHGVAHSAAEYAPRRAADQRIVSEQGGDIVDSAQHMLRPVKDLLGWTKLARAQIQLDLKVVPVAEIVGAVVADLGPDVQAKGLELTSAIDSRARFTSLSRGKRSGSYSA